MKDIITAEKHIPIVAIRGSVVFPHTDSILAFGRPKSVAAVNSAFQSDRVIAIFTQKRANVSNPTAKDLYSTGTLATITQMMSNEMDIHAMVQGKSRVSLKSMIAHEPYLIGTVEMITETDQSGKDIEDLAGKLGELFRKAVNLGKGVDITTIMRVLSKTTEPKQLVDSVSSLLDLKTREKQKLLETSSVKARLKYVVEHLAREVNVMDLERVISSKTQKRFENQMRKAMLREKKKTIEEELGEEGESSNGNEITDFKNKIKKSLMPKKALQKAKKELKKLSQLHAHNPEGGYIRNYLDWLVNMPWTKFTGGDVSIKDAQKILDEDHYGLEKTKERIIEYLSVIKLKQDRSKKKKNGENHPTILCFVGPPGVGKTSIGKSIARALGRKFVRVSLGGIRDEAEIRGHRRTYVGALPGRIIQGIRNAGTANPVFMLDEIDKLGADYRGDPSSALLEILDPEQNKEFSDHYLEVPYDLSSVMFICTANILDSIPYALRDRMEIIRFAGYLEDEKYGIAKKYLWPKQLKAHGIKKGEVKISKSALHAIIKSYTREAGVREVERKLANVCRKVARQIAEKKNYQETIGLAQVKKYLGPKQFNSLLAENNDDIGMVTGLAVTQAGGEILFIEVALMPGKGRLTLTGQLGDVMQESVKAAFSWSKSHWKELGLKENFGKNIDVHVHVPEGATPKDGPSAGIAMATALVSALTGIPVKRNVGMTGEVTLRGRVLQIGGVKEKVIAGHSAGLKTIVLPIDNKKDMDDIPKNVKKDINFVFAKTLNDVLRVALKSWNKKEESGMHSSSYLVA